MIFLPQRRCAAEEVSFDKEYYLYFSASLRLRGKKILFD